MTIEGQHFEVIRDDDPEMMRRAARAGATVANGRLYRFYDQEANDNYLYSELNKLRGFGYEKQVFVVGEQVARSSVRVA